MKKFLVKLLIYMIPFVLVNCPFLYAAIKSGEILSYDVIIEKQNSSEDIVVGMAYNEQNQYYKFVNANDKGADVIALGTSRVMQFKEEYFEASFYNCGGGVTKNFNEYLWFLEQMDEKKLPKLIILGGDQWVFNDEWNKTYENYSFGNIEEREIDEVAIIKRIQEDYLDKKWTFKQIFEGDFGFGFSGMVKGVGFKKDGSYTYTDVYKDINNSNDPDFVYTINRINKGISRFEYGEHIDEETINYLDELLMFCKGHNIEVIVFLPPFAPKVYGLMDDQKYGYLDEIYPAVQEICEKYTYECYDFSDVSILGCNDDYFIDGFHGSDIVYGMMVKEMCDHNSCIKQYVDELSLQEMISHRYSNLVFEEVK